MSLFVEGKMQVLWLVQLESADGKLKAQILDKAQGAPQATAGDATLADGTLRFTLTVGETPFQFEGQLPKGDAKLVTGNIAQARGQALPAELERTALKSLDQFELEKEALAKATGFQVATTAMSLLAEAGRHKAKPEEVRSWADKAYKAAEPYGARVQGDILLNIAEALAEQEGYADIAVTFARRAERGLDPKAKMARVKHTLDVLLQALVKAGNKPDEVKEVEARIAKLNPEITPAPFAGRKAKSDRAVLVELFTGAQCPPCVAADKAFDALGQTYKPGEVVLLEYHMHIPGPDPLTNPAAEARYRYYFARDPEAGTPASVFNGKPAAAGGGGAFDAVDKYEQYQGVINPLLEQPSKGALKAGAARKGNKVEITAEASDVAVADGVRLRLALVEAAVDYKGSNGIPSYHHVVRDMPGGTTGIAVKDRAAKQAVTVDLDELKKDHKKYLENYAAENEAKFGKLPEMELKNLRVVAFLQNDKTKEVLQAVQVDVKAEK
jgi:hypothetical protein